ncbi:hypothetical protein [Methylobacterium tarhaniae]|uniref:hypothetical protein n=1 Tax=Methylobacterium tarhaniae TaxID=1187852 RepID=UPI003D0547B3
MTDKSGTTELFPRRVEGKTATALEEIEVIVSELIYALNNMKCAIKFLSSPDNEDEANIVTNALYRDSIVRFISCFNGKNKLSSEEFCASLDDASEYFQYILDLRNSWVAHAHGASQQAEAVVYIDDSGNIIGTGCILFKLCGKDKDEMAQFHAFISFALKYAANIKTELEQKFDAEIKNKTREQLLSMKNSSFRALEPEEVALSRNQYRNKTPPHQWQTRK